MAAAFESLEGVSERMEESGAADADDDSDPRGAVVMLDSPGVYDPARAAPLFLDDGADRGVDLAAPQTSVPATITGQRLILELVLSGGAGLDRVDVRSLASVFGTTSAPISLSPPLLDALESMRSTIESTVEDEERRETRIVAVATAAGTSLTAGFVTWLLRSGLLVATALTTTPLWRPLDPVPILAAGLRRDGGGSSPAEGTGLHDTVNGGSGHVR